MSQHFYRYYGGSKNRPAMKRFCVIVVQAFVAPAMAQGKQDISKTFPALVVKGASDASD